MAMNGNNKRVGPLALTATLTTNVYNQASALIYDNVKQIIVVNKTAASHNFTLYVGASAGNAAGTELFNGEVVPANTQKSWFYNNLKLTSADFLVGGADAGTALTITIVTEQVVV
jgi:hypothetical protein